MRSLIAAAVLFSCSIPSVFAQGITGQWKTTMEGMGEPMEIVFTFKAEGTTLTGVIKSPMGDMQVQNGKVNGASFTFDVDLNGQMMPHKGTMSGDTISMSIEGFQDNLKLTRVAATSTAATPAVPAATPAGSTSGIDGKWKAVLPDIDLEITFTFKVSGSTVTGSVSGKAGVGASAMSGINDMPITNGKVNGNTFTFDVDAGGQAISHKCTFANGEITMEASGFQEPMKLTRVKE